MLPGSSISHLAGAANSKLASFLRAREDEEARLIGAAKLRNLRDPNERPRPHSPRFSQPASFSRPSPLVERGQILGVSPFHLKLTTVSKRAPDPGLATYERPGASSTPGLDHAEYIERDGAAEGVDASRESYLSRGGAVEQVGRPSGLGGIERAALGVPELDSLGSAPQVADRLAIVSNISDDIFERQHFWSLVEQHERTTRTVNIVAHPGEAPEWWTALRATGIRNKELEGHLLAEERRFQVSQGSFRPRTYKAPLDQAERLFGQLRSLPGWMSANAPVRARKRSGRTQLRFVAELPAGIPAHARLQIVRDFCAKLEVLETNDKGALIGLMYTAVIHAPDAQNHTRNYHMHLIGYDRPCRYLPEHAEWDFAVEDTYVHRGQKRPRYPHRQKKLTVSQSRRVSGREGTGKGFPKALREMFADSVNAVLKHYESERLYHPGSYSECGIDRTPTAHLGRMFPAEQIGVATKAGDSNAQAIWGDIERTLEAEHAARARRVEARLVEAATAIHSCAGSGHSAVNYLRHARGVVDAAKGVLRERFELEVFDLHERKGRSRAEYVRAYCDEQLDGRGCDTERTRKEQAGLRKRREEAAAFLHDLEVALASERAGLRAAVRDLDAREAKFERALSDLRQAIALVQSLSTPAHASVTKAHAAAAAPTGGSDDHAIPARAPERRPPVPAIDAVKPALRAPEPAEAQVTSPRESSPRDSMSAEPASHGRDAAAGADEPASASPPRPDFDQSLRARETSSRDDRAAHAEQSDPASMPLEPIAQETAASVPEECAEPLESSHTDRTLASPNELERSRIPDGHPPGKLPLAHPSERKSPAGTASRAAARERVGAIMDRVVRDRLVVVEHVTATGPYYSVPELQAELTARMQPSVTALLQARLRAQHGYQELEVSRFLKWAEARAPGSMVGFHEELRSAPKAIRTFYKKWSKHDRVHAFERTLRTTPVILPEWDTGGDHVHSNARVAAELPAGTPKLDLANEEPVTAPRETQKEDEGLVDLLWHLQNGRGAGR